MKIFIIAFLVISGAAFSQKIEWERTVSTSYYGINSDKLIINIDNKGDFLITTDGRKLNYEIEFENGQNLKYRYRNVFAKVSSTGDSLFYGEILDSTQFYPLSIFNNNNNYKIFGLYDSSNAPKDKNKLLPKIVNVDDGGQVVEKISKYDIHNSEHYEQYATKFEDINSIIANSDSIVLNANIVKVNFIEHIQITAYDHNGFYLWTKLIAPHTGFGGLYLRDMTYTNNLFYLHYTKDIVDAYIPCVVKLDASGEIKKMEELSLNDSFGSYGPFSVSKNGNIAILGKYDSDSLKKILILNSDIELIKEIEIVPDSSNYTNILNIHLTKDDEVYAYGYSILANDDDSLQDKIRWKHYLGKYSITTGLEWHYHWRESFTIKDQFGLNESSIKNSYIDENGMLYLFGVVDNWSFYVAKINTGINSVQPNDLTDPIVVYPNPAADQINISNFEFGIGQNIEIYNALGEKVISRIPNGIEQNVDVSALPRGLYFVRIGDKVQKFVKK